MRMTEPGSPERQGTPERAAWDLHPRPTSRHTGGPGLHVPGLSHSYSAWPVWLRRAEMLAAGGAHGVSVPAWMRPTRGEHRWPVTLSVIAAIVLQILLPPRLSTPIPRAVLPALEGALLIGLSIANPVRIEHRAKFVRVASLVLVLLISAANAASAVLLVKAILEAKAGNSATPLLATGANIWATNVIAFALWYWEFDRGGPVQRARGTSKHPDLMFPQMVTPELAAPDWEPRFVDYLYLAYTNATAFSPTDVMPLAKWAKLTMLVQSAVSLSMGALVIARAVNILR
jgi:uncharacterized membrane protein